MKLFHIHDTSSCENSMRPVLKTLEHIHNCPNWTYDYHVHAKRAEINYIQNGTGTYTLNNIPFQVKPKDLIVINPGILHSVRSNPHYPLNVWSFCIEYGLNEPENESLLPSNAYPVVTTGYFSDLIEEIVNVILCEHQASAKTTVIDELISALYIIVQELYDRSDSPAINMDESFTNMIMAYINDHYTEPITLQTLSKTFFVSSSHISHEMSRVYGISPIEYLIRRRLNAAKWKLIMTDDIIPDIALFVGYENSNHFSKLFAKRLGITPQAFREKYSYKRD